MKRILSVLLSMLLVLAMAACGGETPAPDSDTVEPEAQSEDGAAEESYDDIAQLFADVCTGEVSVHNRNGHLEVRILSNDLTADAAPEAWTDILDRLGTALEASEQKAAETYGSQTVTAQLELEDGTVLASGYGGVVKFDLFTADTTYKEVGNGVMTLALFGQIQTGMSYQEVRDIVGGDGELISSVDIGEPELKTEMYTWNGNGPIGSNANVMFQGGKVSSKGQFGLE